MNLKSLIDKLTPAAKQALQDAAALAVKHQHSTVEPAHWLIALMNKQDEDLLWAVNTLNVNGAVLRSDLDQVMEHLPKATGSAPGLAPALLLWIETSWNLASLEFNETAIRPAYLMIALLEELTLSVHASGLSSTFGRMDSSPLRTQLPLLLEQHATGAPSSVSSVQEALAQFTINLTERAKSGAIDPVLGREHEIRQVIDILCRRRQNNPILTGEPGVGKTAVVEGLALRIATGEVPDFLQNVELRTLDLGLLQAGAGVKGEFENRLKGIMEEVAAANGSVILFIDEAHMMVGAGGQAGQADAANLLKPALARGELRTIAATTWAEYKKYFEKDAALSRRFQVVKVEEPNDASAIAMMRGLKETLESHHNISLTDDAVVQSVLLSKRYIAGRQLPDKCISVLDTACARVKMTHHVKPASLERLESGLEHVQREAESVGQEHAILGGFDQRLRQLSEERKRIEAEIAALETRWQTEKSMIADMQELRAKVVDRSVGEEDRQQAIGVLRDQINGLTVFQNGHPLCFEAVTGDTVAQVIADWTGIPVGKMQSEQIHQLLGMADHLKQRVIGQDHALDLLGNTLKTSGAKLSDPDRPIGVFMLIGTSGVGKTETALALAEQLYGSSSQLTVINMSEFKEEHKVSLLLGSPPGYVGYGEGGVLTEAVRRKPYSVVLLDEIEKAHPGVQDIFYQVFDKGTIKDGEGRDIDFRNTVIIMTTNAASDQIMALVEDPDTRPDHQGLLDAVRTQLLNVFKPAFLGRAQLIPFFPLAEAELKRIAQLQLQRIKQRFEQQHDAAIEFGESVLALLIERCNSADAGARQLHNVIANQILPELSDFVLTAMLDGQKLEKLVVNYETGSGMCFRPIWTTESLRAKAC